MDIDPKVVAKLPEVHARRHRALVVKADPDVVMVALSDPADLNAVEAVSNLLSAYQLEFAIVRESQLLPAYDRLYRRTKDIEAFAGQLENEHKPNQELDIFRDVEDESNEATVVKFLNSARKYYSTTWEKVSKQIIRSSLFGGELAKTSYYETDLQNILKKTTSDYEKVGAIFNFLKLRMKWNGIKGEYSSKGVKKAYVEKVGNVADINLILISMLQFAGLNANAILVSSKGNGIPLFPTLDGFNYVIAIVEFQNGGYVLSANNNFYPKDLFISNSWEPNSRAERIDKLLSEKNLLFFFLDFMHSYAIILYQF